MIEAGWEEDAEKVREIRNQHPGVVCLALGDPLDATLFDGVFRLPLEPDKVRNSVYFQAKHSNTTERHA